MADIPTPAGGPRYFSIVVGGIMTPAMHHPLWYQLIGCLTKPEADAALLRTAIVTNQAQFQTAADGGIRMTCSQDRWEIAAWKEEDRPRLLEIASKVFEKLMETPVNVYAFFAMADLDTKIPKVKNILGDLAVATGLGFEADGDRSCGFHFENLHETHAINVIVRPSEQRESQVWVSYAAQYPIKSVSGYYTLGPELAKNFDPHWQAAKEMGHRIVARVNGYAERPGVANAN